MYIVHPYLYPHSTQILTTPYGPLRILGSKVWPYLGLPVCKPERQSIEDLVDCACRIERGRE